MQDRNSDSAEEYWEHWAGYCWHNSQTTQIPIPEGNPPEKQGIAVKHLHLDLNRDNCIPSEIILGQKTL